MTCYITRNRKL